MDWQIPEDTVPSSIITAAQFSSLKGKPPITGAWRDGDHEGDRLFEHFADFRFEYGAGLDNVRVAYESWGELNDDKSNAILILHALTGDSHVVGSAGPGHSTGGWWNGVVGPGLAIDTDSYCVIAPNILGGCQGSTGPSSLDERGNEWGSRFPFTTIRDQVALQRLLQERLAIPRWAAVVGGSMGGMHALEWAITFPDALERLAVLAAPAIVSADQLALNSVQLAAIRSDPHFSDGDYYDPLDGEGPHRGLALARRMALLNYRSPDELNKRFSRSWQSEIDPLGAAGKFAVESYLDFHGNKFTRRFDAGSYITLVESMNSHDVGRGRGGVRSALQSISALTLVLGIDSDRLFPLADQRVISGAIRHSVSGAEPAVISSEFGHDGFLIEHQVVGAALHDLLASAPADAAPIRIR